MLLVSGRHSRWSTKLCRLYGFHNVCLSLDAVNGHPGLGTEICRALNRPWVLSYILDTRLVCQAEVLTLWFKWKPKRREDVQTTLVFSLSHQSPSCFLFQVTTDRPWEALASLPPAHCVRSLCSLWFGGLHQLPPSLLSRLVQSVWHSMELLSERMVPMNSYWDRSFLRLIQAQPQVSLFTGKGSQFIMSEEMHTREYTHAHTHTQSTHCI